MPTELSAAGDSATFKRAWTISQGAGVNSVNGIRPFTLADPDDPDSERLYTDWTDGYTARAQIRAAVGGEVWQEFSSEDVSGPRIELTSDGWVRLLIPAATTEDEAWDSRNKGVYDLEVIDSSGNVERLLEGRVTVAHDVTREEESS